MILGWMMLLSFFSKRDCQTENGRSTASIEAGGRTARYMESEPSGPKRMKSLHTDGVRKLPFNSKRPASLANGSLYRRCWRCGCWDCWTREYRRRSRPGARSLADRFLHECGDPCLFGRSQPLQREGGRPHIALVEVRLVAEAERRVPRLELRSCLEEADDLIVLGIRGHPVPESRRESWRAFSDYSMKPFGHAAIRFPHLGDLRQHGALPLALASLHLLNALPYCASLLLSERLAGPGGALGGLLRALLYGFHGIRFVFLELKYFFTSSFPSSQPVSLGCCRMRRESRKISVTIDRFSILSGFQGVLQGTTRSPA